MKILSVNAGSSSLKFQLYEMPEERALISGVFERIGIGNSFYTIKLNGEKIKKEVELKDHKDAFEILVKELIDNKVINSCDEIKAVGHRTVQGGEKYDHTVVIDDSVIGDMEKYAPLAPLHNPAAIVGIKASQEVFPDALQTAVFDTAFHATMDEVNYIYPVPYEWYTEYGVRKYGAHGTSHLYVSRRLAEIVGKDIKNLKIVTCHLGQGSSITAVEGGRSIDTSMGLTPLGGIPMVTRSGDLDPSVVTYIMKKENLTADQVENILNKKSGLQAISGMAPDFREIEAASYGDNEDAAIAIEKFKYEIAGFIAKYAVAMNGIDYIVFTGGVGENQILPFGTRGVARCHCIQCREEFAVFDRSVLLNR